MLENSYPYSNNYQGSVSNQCPKCMGTGLGFFINQYGQTVTENPCSMCKGTGILQPGMVNNLPNPQLMQADIVWIKDRIKRILKVLDIPED